jgi:hypothetical protein
MGSEQVHRTYTCAKKVQYIGAPIFFNEQGLHRQLTQGASLRQYIEKQNLRSFRFFR